MYVAGRICEQLGFCGKDGKLIRLAGLLHDIGHGPFSHVFEQVIAETTKEKFSHVKITSLILENNNELRKTLGGSFDELAGILRFEKEDARCEVLSGPLDADRLDYLRRDSYHTGVAYGVYDFERVIRNLCLISDETRNYIGIHEKGKDAVESYRMARYLMHTQVYEHHTRLVAEDMFLRTIKFALDEAILDRDALNPNEDVSTFLDYFMRLDDNYIQYLILTKSKGKAKKIIYDLMNRKLLKRAYIIPISTEAIPNYTERMKFLSMKEDAVRKLEYEIASQSGLEPDELILHLQSTEIKLYEDLEETLNVEEKPILVKHYDGLIRHIGEESPFSASLIPKRLYIFCSDKEKERVGKIAEEIIGVKNHYSPKEK
jgi:HD superfamily phosphohydrolase